MRKLLVVIFLSCFPFFFATNALAANEKNWTILFFANGNNDLDEDTENAIKNLEQVGSNEQINVVVQWASASSQRAVRMLSLKSSNPTKVTSPILQDLGLIDMGDYRVLEDFIQWGVQHFPAKHYFIVVSDHGTGWHRFSTRRFSDISRDEISGHLITTPELGKAMRFAAKLIGHKVDVYASDACYMSMIEVANELAGTADYVAGSQDGEPAYGWPYSQLLSLWEAQPVLTPSDLVRILVKEYINFYNDRNDGDVTYSVYEMSQLMAVNEALTELAKKIEHLGPRARKQILYLVRQTTRFADGDYGDLVGFMNLLSTTHLIDSATLDKVIKACESAIAVNGVSAYYKNKVFGMSIWLPLNKAYYDKYRDQYKTMKFNLLTHWGDAIAALVQGN